MALLIVAVVIETIALACIGVRYGRRKLQQYNAELYNRGYQAAIDERNAQQTAHYKYYEQYLKNA